MSATLFVKPQGATRTLVCPQNGVQSVPRATELNARTTSRKAQASALSLLACEGPGTTIGQNAHKGVEAPNFLCMQHTKSSSCICVQLVEYFKPTMCQAIGHTCVRVILGAMHIVNPRMHVGGPSEIDCTLSQTTKRAHTRLFRYLWTLSLPPTCGGHKLQGHTQGGGECSQWKICLQNHCVQR